MFFRQIDSCLDILDCLETYSAFVGQIRHVLDILDMFRHTRYVLDISDMF